MKTNLPVILLRGLVLLPHNEIRLEFDNDESKNIIDVASLFHDNYVLVTSYKDTLEETTDKEKLPKVGVISKITHRIELPNGKTRVVIKGEKRVFVYDYLNIDSNDILESIVGEIKLEVPEVQEEAMLVRKVYQELENYISAVSYMSNSILNHTKNVKELSKLTDMIAPELPLTLERLIAYLETTNSKERAMMVLTDIYEELENYRIEEEIDHKLKKEIDNSQKEYLLREKIRILKEELGEVDNKEAELDELSLRIDLLDAPKRIKERLTKEKLRLESLPPMSQEVAVITNYIDKLLDLPWNKLGEEVHDLAYARQILNKSHYGLDKIKTRIIEYLAVKEKTGSLNGPILCLVGPPGVGKTSLASSIATALGRKFVKFSVGGMDDEAEIMGHRRTYLGSEPGRIINSLIKAGVSNPVLLIDEIDKMVKGYHGDPASALLEVLDPEQNAYFSDHYIEEEVDLSHVLFIVTANYIDDIPEALKDRLEIIELGSYTAYEKLKVANNYLIPKQKEIHGLKQTITFTKKALLELINYYTKEAGVRELERLIGAIFRKIVTDELLEENILDEYKIDVRDIKKYLGKRKFDESHLVPNEAGIVNGLAYTRYGGDTLAIEVTFYPGKGTLVLTGSLGDVMKESCHIAYSYVKANYQKFGIDYELLSKQDVHIHVPNGAVPKDGPSAGIALTTALISAFTGKKINQKIALTGEITLRGNVLPIGGLKEKSIGANRNHITTIFIPKDNVNDLEDIPEEVRKTIKYIPVINYTEVYEKLFKKDDVVNGKI